MLPDANEMTVDIFLAVICFMPAALTLTAGVTGFQLMPKFSEYSMASWMLTCSPDPSADFIKTAAAEFLSESDTTGTSGLSGTIRVCTSLSKEDEVAFFRKYIFIPAYFFVFRQLFNRFFSKIIIVQYIYLTRFLNND